MTTSIKRASQRITTFSAVPEVRRARGPSTLERDLLPCNLGRLAAGALQRTALPLTVRCLLLLPVRHGLLVAGRPGFLHDLRGGPSEHIAPRLSMFNVRVRMRLSLCLMSVGCSRKPKPRAGSPGAAAAFVHLSLSTSLPGLPSQAKPCRSSCEPCGP